MSDPGAPDTDTPDTGTPDPSTPDPRAPDARIPDPATHSGRSPEPVRAGTDRPRSRRSGAGAFGSSAADAVAVQSDPVALGRKHSSDIYVGVGGNLPFDGRIGPDLFESVIEAASQFNISVISSSCVWQSRAWPDPPTGRTRPDFFNAVWRVAWPGDDPFALLDALNALEERFGRVRAAPNADRTLDLDILDFRGEVLGAPRLMLPHPRMRERRFVLGPLADLAPDWRCPVTRLGVAALLAALGPDGDAHPLDTQTQDTQTRDGQTQDGQTQDGQTQR